MRLYAHCKNCDVETSFSTFAETRIDYVQSKSETKEIECKNCGNVKEFHIDELQAKESKVVLIIALLILIIGTPIVFYLVSKLVEERGVLIIGGFMALPAIIYEILKKQEQEKVSMFNRHKVRGNYGSAK
jgi:hypothetical protein